MTLAKGTKLMNPKSPHVIRALMKKCPGCGAPPQVWCHTPKGRKVTRIHYARAEFQYDEQERKRISETS